LCATASTKDVGTSDDAPPLRKPPTEKVDEVFAGYKGDEGFVRPSTQQFVSTVAEEKVVSVRGDPLHGVITLLSFAGVLETAYLTILKLTSSAPALCLSSGSCEAVLSSKYSELFHVPLPAFGMLAYGAICALSVQGALAKKEGREQNNSALLGAATVAATTSFYLMLTLATKLDGQACVYCYTSAALSASILLATLPGWKGREAASGLAVSIAVVSVLAFGFGDLSGISVYNDSNSSQAQAAELNIPYETPAVTTVSTPEWISLAKHLKATGAQMYGAFWCSHCLEQKVLFGAEAVREGFGYVECFPDGYKRGTTMSEVCKAADLQGFPTWVINGQKLEGDQTFDQLATASNFKR